MTEAVDWSDSEFFARQSSTATRVLEDAREGATAFAEKRAPGGGAGSTLPGMPGDDDLFGAAPRPGLPRHAAPTRLSLAGRRSCGPHHHRAHLRPGAATTPLITGPTRDLGGVTSRGVLGLLDRCRTSQANPGGQVFSSRGDVIPVRARAAEGDERRRLWDLMAEQWPAYNDYAPSRQSPGVVSSARRRRAVAPPAPRGPSHPRPHRGHELRPAASRTDRCPAQSGPGAHRRSAA